MTQSDEPQLLRRHGVELFQDPQHSGSRPNQAMAHSSAYSPFLTIRERDREFLPVLSINEHDRGTMYECLHARMMDGWVGGRVGGWMDGWMSICMYGCMYFMYVLHVCMYACMYVGMSMSRCVHTYIRACTYIHTCTHTYIHTYICENRRRELEIEVRVIDRYMVVYIQSFVCSCMP